MPRKRKGGKPGMPSALTPEVFKNLVTYLTAGNPRRWAAAACGISHETLYQWRRLARKGHEPYRQLFAEIDKAMYQAAVRNVMHVNKAAAKDWRAAAYWLERMYPRQFGRKHRYEVTGPEGAPLLPQLDLQKLTDEQLRRVARGEPLEERKAPEPRRSRREAPTEDD